MSKRFERTEILIGEEGMEKLKKSHVAIFGIGGVGGYVAEILTRSGVGKIDLIDNDTVSETNINRQIIALTETIGKYKTHVMRDRILSINPDAEVKTHEIFFMPDTEMDFSSYDYVIDAIDTVTAKIEIIMRAKNSNVNVISSMGTGNKLDPTRFEIADIYKTTVCPLAKVMRRELKKRGVDRLKVLYSKEEPIKQQAEDGKKPTPASISFVPSAAGLIIAGEVIKELTYEYNK